MSKIVIVGAGLFGSVAAALCRKAGHKVTVIDAQKEGRASRCSGNLLKRSWLTALSKEQIEDAYTILGGLYGVLHNDKIGLDWVNPALVLQPADVDAEVYGVEDGCVHTFEHGKIVKYRGKVLVAAGVWSEELVKMPKIRWLVGASLRIKGQLKEPVTQLYAPYKQTTAYNIDSKHIWAGDGVAILRRNWSSNQRLALLNSRVGNLGVSPIGAEVRIGYRPYVPGYKTGYFSRVYDNTWVSTGGAKNGLVLSAVLAKRFLEEI